MPMLCDPHSLCHIFFFYIGGQVKPDLGVPTATVAVGFVDDLVVVIVVAAASFNDDDDDIRVWCSI